MKSFQRYLIYNRRKNKISTALDSAHATVLSLRDNPYTGIRQMPVFSIKNEHQQASLPMFILLLFIVRLTQSQRDYSMIVATRPECIYVSMHYQALSHKSAFFRLS